MRILAAALHLTVAVTASQSLAQDAFDVDAGEAQFVASCGTCHVLDPSDPPRQGPPLRAVFERPAATLPDFAYSDAMRRAGQDGLIWTEQALDQWIANSGGFLPGTTMFVRQRDPEKRALIIAYLRWASGASGERGETAANQ